jgi:hypothetical protein
MRTRAAVLVPALSLLAAVSLPAQQRPQVMILGTYHMNNPGLDYANLQADDVLAERRQAEIAAVTQALAEFRPTRIAVEVTPAQDSVLNASYRAYLAGTRPLTRNEHEQIGFRLARQLGHARLYPVDWKLDLDIGAVMGFAAQNGQADVAQRLGAEIQALMARMQREMGALTVGEILRRANAPAADSLHGNYLVMATIGRDSAYVGADMVADWYSRNLHIFANIARIATPGERVLVIIGSGHGTLLREFIAQSPDLELVAVEEYFARFRTPQ